MHGKGSIVIPNKVYQISAFILLLPGVNPTKIGKIVVRSLEISSLFRFLTHVVWVCGATWSCCWCVKILGHKWLWALFVRTSDWTYLRWHIIKPMESPDTSWKWAHLRYLSIYAQSTISTTKLRVLNFVWSLNCTPRPKAPLLCGDRCVGARHRHLLQLAS